MTSVQYRKAVPVDFEGILRLQHENLLSLLPEKERPQGFLSIEFTREQIRTVNDDLGIFVAVQDKTVLGYLMAESVEFAVQSRLIAFMLKRLKDVCFEAGPISSFSLLIYGPVCIDKKARGKGVLEGLYRVMRESLKNNYEVGIAFVSNRNPRSLHAHTEKLGMRVVDEFEFKGEKYKALAFRL